MKLPDYVKHILRPGEYDPEDKTKVRGGEAWCGHKAPPTEFVFLDLEHVAGEGLREGPLLACPLCVDAAEKVLTGRRFDFEFPWGTQRVNELCRQLYKDTCFRSDPALDHPLYAELLALGKPGVPALLHLLDCFEDSDDLSIRHPISALQDITGADVIPKEDYGRLRRIIKHWLDWGEAQGLYKRAQWDD